MAPALAAWLLILLVLTAAWIYALIDLVRAVDMEMGARLITAFVLVFVPPVGLVIWLILRAPNRPRLAALVAGTLFLLLVASTAVTAAMSYSPLSEPLRSTTPPIVATASPTVGA